MTSTALTMWVGMQRKLSSPPIPNGDFGELLTGPRTESTH